MSQSIELSQSESELTEEGANTLIERIAKGMYDGVTGKVLTDEEENALCE